MRAEVKTGSILLPFQPFGREKILECTVYTSDWCIVEEST